MLYVPGSNFSVMSGRNIYLYVFWVLKGTVSFARLHYSKKVSEYGQEIPLSLFHTLQTKPRHREEEPQSTNSHKTSGRQLKQSNQLSLPHQVEWTQSTAQQIMEHTQNPNNGSNNEQRINNNRTTLLDFLG